MTGTTVLVTGGSGYIAGFVIQDLLVQGHHVRATLRSKARADEVRDWLGGVAHDPGRLSFVEADLSSDAGWAEAVDGASFVQHVASPIPTVNPRDEDELIRPARDGTLRVLRAARNAGVRRVVITSSIAAIAYGHGSREIPFTEADWTDITRTDDSSAYERSKTIAERAAWDWHTREGGALELATVNPGAVLGPVLGRDFSASLAIVVKLMDGSAPAIPRYGWPIVDVRDVADLHLRAMTDPAAAGKRFIAATEFLWMHEVAALLRQHLGEHARRVPGMRVPDALVRLMGLFDPVIGGRLFELGKKRPVSNARAREVLGWTPRPAARTVIECAESLVAVGAV